MSDRNENDPLASLEDRIDALKTSQAPKGRQDEHYSTAQHAWRMVIELVAGLGIGFGMGYGLDVLFGTLPLFLVIFTLLGFVAGVKTMIGSANEAQEKILAAEAEKERGFDRGK